MNIPISYKLDMAPGAVEVTAKPHPSTTSLEWKARAAENVGWALVEEPGSSIQVLWADEYGAVLEITKPKQKPILRWSQHLPRRGEPGWNPSHDHPVNDTWSTAGPEQETRWDHGIFLGDRLLSAQAIADAAKLLGEGSTAVFVGHSSSEGRRYELILLKQDPSGAIITLVRSFFPDGRCNNISWLTLQPE